MEKLMQTLNDAVSQAIALYDKLSTEKELNDAERQGNKSVAADLDQRAAEIVNLENEWRAIRKIVNFKEKILTLQKETRAFQKKLTEDRANFERERNMLLAEVKDIKAQYKEKEADFVSKVNQLNRDRKNYKEEIQIIIDKQLRAKGVKL